LPDITAKGQGGLMDVALHPNFADNRWVYLSYAASGRGGIGTEVARGRLVDNRLQDLQVLFRALPKASGGRHFGSRLLFAPDGFLYISLGERGQRPQAQSLGSHLGTMIRLHDDGRVPADNPFAGRAGAMPEIYSYGHRNIQGLALQPGTGRIWAHEHGPQGGDELNLLGAGRNYGWPVITYGRNYVTGTRIGEGERKAGMEQPVHYWVPSIAPSGLAFYQGDKFPGWKGDALIGSLKFSYLVRLKLENQRVIHEEILLEGLLTRIRDVRTGPDGYVYLLTDENNGKLVRLQPAG
jgi:glucose/arabinose dehydrogenase